MQKNNYDSFENHSSIDVQSSSDNITDNFFIQNEIKRSKKITEPKRRLNDYDSNILEEDAYKDVNDDLFKLEYKISKTEQQIKELNTQLSAAMEINDNILAENLNNKINILKKDYETLLSQYNNKSLSTKISGNILNLFGAKIGKKYTKNSILQNLYNKIPKKFTGLFEIRKSLNQLENLNKSVSELVNLTIPYGEDVNKYEQLSKYIIKANSIQSEISNVIKRKKK